MVRQRQDEENELRESAARHIDRLGKISGKTKISLALACVIAGGVWKLAFAVSDAAHELHDIKIAQSTFLKVSEMETWQSYFKLNMTQLGKPLGDAVPDVRIVVNQARQQNETHEN